MGQKGDHTKVLIKEKARELFGEKGFSCVTMKEVLVGEIEISFSKR